MDPSAFVALRSRRPLRRPQALIATAAAFPRDSWALQTLRARAAELGFAPDTQVCGCHVFGPGTSLVKPEGPDDPDDLDARPDPLASAILANDPQGICDLVRGQGHNPSRLRGAYGSTLSLAINADKYSAFCALVHCGADVNTFHRKGKTPLHVACSHPSDSRWRYVVALVGAPGIQLDAIWFGAQGAPLWTPLYVAIRSDNIRAARSLVDAGAATAWLHDPRHYHCLTLPEIASVPMFTLLGDEALGGDPVAIGHMLSRPVSVQGPASVSGPVTFTVQEPDPTPAPDFATVYDDTVLACLLNRPAVFSDVWLSDVIDTHRVAVTESTYAWTIRFGRPGMLDALGRGLRAPLNEDAILQTFVPVCFPASNDAEDDTLLAMLGVSSRDGGCFHPPLFTQRAGDMLGAVLALQPRGLFSAQAALLTPSFGALPVDLCEQVCAGTGDVAVAAARDHEGNTPLHVLCAGPLASVDRVDLLVRHGVDPRAHNAAGQTCLHALVSGHGTGCTCSQEPDGLVEPSCVLCHLVDGVGVDPCVQDCQGNTFLHLAAGCASIASRHLHAMVALRNRQGVLPLKSLAAAAASGRAVSEDVLCAVADATFAAVGAPNSAGLGSRSALWWEMLRPWG